MNKVTLYIETRDEAKTIELEDEVSIGRTNLAQIVLNDVGLSRVNTTFFRDGELVFVVDENSTNGSFINGERNDGKPQRVLDGDEIKIGSETRIRVEISQSSFSNAPPIAQSDGNSQTTNSGQNVNPQTANRRPLSKKPPLILIAAVASTIFIILFAAVAILIASRYEGDISIVKGKPTPKIVASAPVPIRVVDPLGTEEPESLDDLMSAWEVQDAEFDAKDLQAVTTSTDAPQLAVSIADWETERNLAMGRRSAPVGLVSGVVIPPELGGGISKQLALFKQIGITPATLPKDFAALARKRMNNELVELPLATKYYYLDNIGTSADGSPFDSFEPATQTKTPLLPGSEDYKVLQNLANNYNGQKYDLNNPSDRLQMKRRLLRMFHPRAKAFLEELGAAYQQKFGRPLKVTSLTRSLEYQSDLTRATRNAYRGTTPPHSTGATFDLGYMQMTAEEQNFLLAKFAEYERAGRIDALREVAQTPCYHIFVFP